MNRERKKEKIKRLKHTQFIGPRPLGEGAGAPSPLLDPLVAKR